ncbi:helix-turn-helix domain-containing protein [Sorangium sp. So ce1504]|uniref:helix-turn-helix domain-containing protein n=1 Tax=Sorangium sp. So ce1504 TaxID=3133337 RepID=UPI003F618D55
MLLDGRAQLVDLGSRNGTLLNGVRVDGARPLGSGDVVSIGEAVVVMRCPRPAKSRQVLEIAELRRRIEGEIDRALRHDRPATVIAVQLGAASAREVVAGALERELAVTDFAGFEADDRLLVLLPEADATAAGHAVQRLVDAVHAVAAAPKVGVATAPADGCDAGKVKAGRFRQDLYYRLGAATVILPPLRERPREILALSRAFLADACARAGSEEMVLSTEATELFTAYAWPGNVRELKNVIDYIAATVSARIVERGHLPAALAAGPPRPEGIPPSVAPASRAAPSARGAGRTFRPLAEEVRELERTRIAEALAAVGGVQTRAAEALHMPLRTFVLKMNRYGLAKRRR